LITFAKGPNPSTSKNIFALVLFSSILSKFISPLQTKFSPYASQDIFSLGFISRKFASKNGVLVVADIGNLIFQRIFLSQDSSAFSTKRKACDEVFKSEKKVQTLTEKVWLASRPSTPRQRRGTKCEGLPTRCF